MISAKKGMNTLSYEEVHDSDRLIVAFPFHLIDPLQNFAPGTA